MECKSSACTESIVRNPRERTLPTARKRDDDVMNESYFKLRTAEVDGVVRAPTIVLAFPSPRALPNSRRALGCKA